MSARTVKGQKSVERILDAAAIVVSREGHLGATTRGIAAEAGVDKRVLSYYFESREALLAEVVSRTAVRVAETITQQLDELPVGELSARKLLGVVWDGIVSEPALVRTYIAILGVESAGGQMAAAIERMNVQYTGLVRGGLVELGHDEQRAGQLAGVATVVIRGLLLSWSEHAPESLIANTLDALAGACDPP